MNKSRLKILFLVLLFHISGSISAMDGDTIVFRTTQIDARTGNQICIPVEVENFKDIVSLQFGVAFNPELLSYQVSYGAGLPDIRYGETRASQGELRMLWFDSALSPANLDDGTTIVEICFEVIGFNNESTTLEIKPLEMLEVEIVNINDELVPYKVESGSIDILNFSDCFMLPYCTEGLRLDYEENIEITPGMLVDDYDYMLGCFNITEDDIRILDLTDLDAVPKRTITIGCSNLREKIDIAILQVNNGPFPLTLCTTELQFSIAAADESCIQTELSCYNPAACRDITINLDSTRTFIAYQDLVDIDDIESCALSFNTTYTSIAQDAMELSNGFTLSCNEYRPKLPITIFALKEFSDGRIVNLEMCTSMITMENIKPVCLEYDIPSGTFPITIVNDIGGIYPNLALVLNKTNVNIVSRSVYEAKVEELLDIPNFISIANNEATLQGHSILDLVLTFNALIGEELSATQAIAADVDLSGSLTTKDLFEMRRTILGLKKPEHIGKAFLVETRTDFTQFDLFEFNNSFTQYQFESTDLDPSEGLKFEAFYYGDINSVKSSVHKSLDVEWEIYTIKLKDQKLLANHTYSIPIEMTYDQRLIAAGAQLKLDNALLLDVKHNYTGDAFNYNIPDPTRANFIYLDHKNEEKISFEIVISPIVDTKLSKVLNIGADLIPEIVGADLSTALLSLAWVKEDDKVIDLCVFPNPATDLINIEVPQAFIGGQLELYSILGKQVMNQTITKQSLTLNLSDYPIKGVGIIRINDGEEIQSAKLFIE